MAQTLHIHAALRLPGMSAGALLQTTQTNSQFVCLPTCDIQGNIKYMRLNPGRTGFARQPAWHARQLPAHVRAPARRTAGQRAAPRLSAANSARYSGRVRR
jgi:hypothetical protein